MSVDQDPKTIVYSWKLRKPNTCADSLPQLLQHFLSRPNWTELLVRVISEPEQANPLRSMKTFACPKRCTSAMSETNGERHKIPKVDLMYEPTLKPCISAQSASTVYTYICPAYVRKYCGILYVIM